MIPNAASSQRFGGRQTHLRLPLVLRFEITCPNRLNLGVTGYEIDSKEEGCSDETARRFKVSGLFSDVACFGKLWTRVRRAMTQVMQIVCFA